MRPARKRRFRTPRQLPPFPQGGGFSRTRPSPFCGGLGRFHIMGLSFRERFSGALSGPPAFAAEAPAAQSGFVMRPDCFVSGDGDRGATPFAAEAERRRRSGRPGGIRTVAACLPSSFSRFFFRGKDGSFPRMRVRPWSFRDVFPSFPGDPALGRRFDTRRAASKNIDTICFYDMEFIHPQYGVSGVFKKPERFLSPPPYRFPPPFPPSLSPFPFFRFPFPFPLILAFAPPDTRRPFQASRRRTWSFSLPVLAHTL